MKWKRESGFTLLELLAVIGIILVLAGLMMVGGMMAQRTAKNEKTKAILESLETACSRYTTVYRSHPYISAESLGLDPEEDDHRLAALVWLLTTRRTEPFMSVDKDWLVKLEDVQKAPDGREFYVAVDAFLKPLRLRQTVAGTNWWSAKGKMTFTSAGPDGEFGVIDEETGEYDLEDEDTRDNLEQYFEEIFKRPDM